MSKSTEIVKPALAKLLETVQLTGTEVIALSYLVSMLYAEPGFSDVCASDMKHCGLNPVQLANALFNLEEEGIIHRSDPEYWQGKVEIPALYYLNSKHWDLHPCEYWQAEQTGG
jgi:hypothetical protein